MSMIKSLESEGKLLMMEASPSNTEIIAELLVSLSQINMRESGGWEEAWERYDQYLT